MRTPHPPLRSYSRLVSSTLLSSIISPFLRLLSRPPHLDAVYDTRSTTGTIRVVCTSNYSTRARDGPKQEWLQRSTTMPINKEIQPKKYYGSTPAPSTSREQPEQKSSSSTPTTGDAKPPSHPQSQHSLKGVFFIILGAFSFSIMYLLVKVMGPNANTFTLVLYRSLVQIVISLTSLLHAGEDPLGPPDCRFWLVIRGLFGSAAVCAWFFGIQILPLPDAVTLQFTTPPFAALFAVFLVGEQWLVIDKIGAVVCLLGVAFIAHPTWLFGSEGASVDEGDTTNTSLALKALAVLITELGAAMAGLAYVSVRKIGHRASAVVMVFYYGALSVPMCILGSGLLEGEWNPFFLDTEFNDATDYLLLIGMGLGGYGGQWFTNIGLQHESAATATLATTSQIVWTYIFEIMFLHEAINGWSLTGTGIIIGYMLIVATLKMIPSQAKEETTPLLKNELHVTEELEGVS